MKNLCGTWRLLSFEIRLSSEKILYPFGKRVKGMLIYTQGGYMSGKLMPHERSNFATSDPLKGTSEEIKEAFQSFIGYFGSYEIDNERGKIKHHVEGSMFPNWEGQIQERFFQLDGHLLTLSTPPMVYGNEDSKGVLVWEKIE